MEQKKSKDNVLYVKMFGSFSMIYAGESVLGNKVSETQFTYMMQILLHNRKNGVSRESLEEMLFGDRDIKNVHHTMQSVIYNAKNKLRKAGLPTANYIRMEKGVFYWTDNILVVEDAAEFDRLYKEAQQEKDINAKLQILLEACHCYTGEFLSMYAGVMWAAQKQGDTESSSANAWRRQQRYSGTGRTTCN